MIKPFRVWAIDESGQEYCEGYFNYRQEAIEWIKKNASEAKSLKHTLGMMDLRIGKSSKISLN